MKRIELLITQSRKATENVDFSDTSGIDDEEFLQYFNDAQREIQAMIAVMFPDVFQKEYTVSVTSGTESYTIPSDAFLGTRVDLVEFSPTTYDRDYYPLKKGSKYERINHTFAAPAYYIRQNNKILLQPIPQGGGKLRVLYQRRLPILDKRRGTVASISSTGTLLNSITLDTTQYIDATNIVEQDYITVVDKYGTIKTKQIPVLSASDTSGVIAIDGTFNFDTGETIDAGDYVLRGPVSTTHSELDDFCEQFLYEYCDLRINIRDSNDDANQVSALLQRFEASIQKAFAEPDGDVERVALLDNQYLGVED